MWLITPVGFFSIVQKPGDKQNDTLTVRSRIRSDLAALRQQYLPGLGPIQESQDTDYRFRAVAPGAKVSAAMARMVDRLAYSNFKSEVAKKQGHKRATLYHQVWNVLHQLQTDPAFVEKEPVTDSYGGVVVSGGHKVLRGSRPSTTAAMPGPLPRPKSSRESHRATPPFAPCARKPATTRKSASVSRVCSRARPPAPVTTLWMPSILLPRRTGRPQVGTAPSRWVSL